MRQSNQSQFKMKLSTPWLLEMAWNFYTLKNKTMIAALCKQ